MSEEWWKPENVDILRNDIDWIVHEVYHGTLLPALSDDSRPLTLRERTHAIRLLNMSAGRLEHLRPASASAGEET